MKSQNNQSQPVRIDQLKLLKIVLFHGLNKLVWSGQVLLLPDFVNRIFVIAIHPLYNFIQ